MEHGRPVSRPPVSRYKSGSDEHERNGGETMLQVMKTDLTKLAAILPKLTEKQQAEMVGWLNGYVAGVEAKQSEPPAAEGARS